MTTETKTALVDAAILSANVEKAQKAAWDMENDLTEIERAAEAITLAASGMGEIAGNDEDVGAFHFLADKLKEAGERIEGRRSTILGAMRGSYVTSKWAIEDIGMLAQDWRTLFDQLHEGETFPIEHNDPEWDRLEGFEEAIRRAPIRSAPDALAKLRLWMAFRADQRERGDDAKTVSEMEAEVLEHGHSFADGDCYVADVFAWLLAICEGEPKQGGEPEPEEGGVS